MEPITTTALALAAWEIIGRPFAEKARDYYSEKALESIPKLWENFSSFNDKDKDIIEAVIIDIPEGTRQDKEKFMEYVTNNIQINKQHRVIYTKTYIENFHTSGTTNFS